MVKNRYIYIYESIFFILISLGFMLYPYIGDDISYRLPFKGYFICGQEVGISDIWDAYLMHCKYENSRIANLFMCFLLFLPQWLCGLMSAAMALLSIRYGAKITGVELSPSAICFLMATFVLLMPWIDQIYIFDFQANYLWAGTFCIILAYIVVSSKIKNIPVLLVISVFVGAWQEATSLPLLVGVGALTILHHRRYLTGQSLTVMLGLLIGLTWLYFSPGGASYRGTAERAFGNRMNILVLYALPSLTYCGFAIFSMLKMRRLSPSDTLLLPIALTSTLIGLLLPMGPRLLWISVLASLIGLTGHIYHRESKGRSILGYSLFALMALNLIAVGWVSWKERKGYEDVRKASLRNSDQTVFIDMTLREDAPLLAFQKPYYNVFAQFANNRIISIFYRTDGQITKVVPLALKEFPSGEEVQINDDGFYLVGKLIVGPRVSDAPLEVAMTVDYGKGERVETFYCVPFVGKNGEPFAWYHYNSSSIEALLNPTPLAISFAK